MASKRRCWLLKSEPEVYSIDDLERDGKTQWDGVRNYQARNYIRDSMQVGDWILFYHSTAEPPGVAGIARVCSEAYAEATEDEGQWTTIDIEFVEKLPRLVPIGELRAQPKLAEMLVLKRWMRLSVQPVEPKHLDLIRRMAAAPGDERPARARTR